MIKNEAYKNRKVATSSGNVHFDEKGHGNGETARAEELLARLDGFELVKKAPAKDEEAPKKAPAKDEEAPKKAPAKKAPAKKAPAKEEAPAEEAK